MILTKEDRETRREIATEMVTSNSFEQVYYKTELDYLDTIADLERQRDTAHAAAIVTVLRIFREQYHAAMMDTGGDREAATYCGLQAIEKLRTDRA